MRETERKRLEQEKWSDEKLVKHALDELNKLSYDVSRISQELSDVIVKLRQTTEYLMNIEHRRRRSAATGGKRCKKQAAGRASTASTKDAIAEQVSTV
jgi:predicted transcriptional regulator